MGSRASPPGAGTIRLHSVAARPRRGYQCALAEYTEREGRHGWADGRRRRTWRWRGGPSRTARRRQRWSGCGAGGGVGGDGPAGWGGGGGGGGGWLGGGEEGRGDGLLHCRAR